MLKKSFFLNVAIISSILLSAPMAFLLPWILGPFNYGLLTFINSLIKYSAIAKLGFFSALPRLIATKVALKRKKINAIIIATAAKMLIFGTMLQSVIFLMIINFVNLDKYEINYSLIIIILSFIMLTNIQGFFIAILKGNGLFITFSKLEIFLIIPSKCIILAGIYLMGIEGNFIALSLGAVLYILIFILKYSSILQFTLKNFFKLTGIRVLIKTGVLLAITKYIIMFYAQIPILIIAFKYNIETVAVWGFAAQFFMEKKLPFVRSFSMLSAFETAKNFGKNDIISNQKLLIPWKEKLFILNMLNIILIVFLVTIIITLFMPNYELSINILFILAGGNIIYGMRFITLNAFFAENKYKTVGITYFIGCCALAVLFYISKNIEQMATFYISISTFMYLFLTIIFLKTKENILQFIKLITKMLIIIFIGFSSYYFFNNLLILEYNLNKILSISMSLFFLLIFTEILLYFMRLNYRILHCVLDGIKVFKQVLSKIKTKKA